MSRNQVRGFGRLFAAAAALLLLGAVCSAQEAGWKMATSKDGAISARYRITKTVDAKGDSVPLIEYVSTTKEKLALAQCVALMKDVPKHKDFQGDYRSEKVREISDTEWVLYYYTKGGGPFPDSDCVTKMVFSGDTARNMATFTFTAAPGLYESKEVGRMTQYTMTYVFVGDGNGGVDITVSACMSPTFSVPAWMLKAVFPEGAFDVLRLFVKMARAV